MDKVYFELTEKQCAHVHPLFEALDDGKRVLLAQVHSRLDGAYVVRVRVIPRWKAFLVALIIRGVYLFNPKGISDQRLDFQMEELGYLSFSEE